MRLALAAVCIAGLLGGCASPLWAITSNSGTASQDLATTRAPVIAMIDSGLSPYYPIFRVAEDSLVRGSVPVPFERVEFALPDPGKDPVDRDRELWDSLQPGVLYHFEGTRLLGISFDGDDRDAHYVRDVIDHGAGTSYLAAREAPGAIIVMAQMKGGVCRETDCLFDPSIADAMEWIAQQDWIDIVSVSLAMPGNLPDRGEVHPEAQRYLAASRAAAASGKVIVNGAGNQPTPNLMGYFNGPPWVISVGGVEHNASGENVHSAKAIDVVANFTEYTAAGGRGEMDWGRGTSFSTPIVSGTIAHALSIVRAAEPERTVGPGEIRAALNASATYFQPTDWEPSPPGGDPLSEVFSLSAPVVAEPQMGWGYVDSSIAPEIARRVLEGDLEHAGKTQAAVFQSSWQDLREAFWRVYG